MAKKRCPRCGGEKEPGRGKRVCNACHEQINQPRPCRSCGDPAPKGVGQHYCADCSQIEREAADARRKARRRLKRYPCEACGRPKAPGNGRHYCERCAEEKAKPKPHPCQRCGDVVVFGQANLCDPCRAEADERRKERNRRYQQRRRSDPATRETYEQSREKYRRKVARRKQGVVNGVEKVPRLPALPLGIAFDRAVERLKRQGVSDPQELLASKCNVSDRTVRAWRTGERPSVNFDKADEVLVGLGLLWWDVWDPAEYPEVEKVMEA